MNRRDLVLGGALGLAAAGAAAQNAYAGAPAKASKPYIPSNYGQTMEILFTTSTDLNAFMPPGLTAVDPHRAFIKAERVKLRSPEADQMPAAFAQYDQICITTMATTPEFGPRHRNILMWENRAWAVGSTLLAVKRWGKVEMTQVFELDHKLVAQGTPVPIYITVEQDGHSLMSFAGALDGVKRVEHPAYPGFYVGGDPGQDLTALTLDASEFSHPVYGSGTLSFGDNPADRGPPGPGKGWSASLLKDIHVEGCVFQDFSFTRTYGGEMKTVRKALPGNGRSRL
uniref:hypothetical protein n=1 Tax=uncultured Caulobacter sp. TaxID=158749 RepID=UPI0025E02FF2|nr:hypothetical protein [uncultured Caulobacter sp.]